MTIYAIVDIKTTNIVCEDKDNEYQLSQLLAFRTKGCADAYYKEVLKNNPNYKVKRMDAK